ncbi:MULTISPECIES: sensor histidine kinase [unclassified Solwaraspora]|uniref:sensor histidine kinase n=1 Tax=unclassified Solwaraspora TaxID=2627926 RepID=UPI00259B187A|nr:HAMP domain-containing sensor histidine kinase [Solwaraspora sp. WMMA2056]WJK40818.1 HAMP domain-containing sensor histidine kinase [Solwaraspora sp. WMMA2056]
MPTPVPVRRPSGRRFAVRRWSHWTLRSRLVVVTAALTAVALVLANSAGLVLLRRSLTDRVDEQLRLMSRPYASAAPPSLDPDGRRPRLFAGPSLQPAQVVLLYDADGTLVQQAVSDPDVALPRLGDYPQLTAQAGTAGPYTVAATDDGDSWRVLVVGRADGGVAVLGVSLHQIDATADTLLVIDVAVVLLILFLLGLGAAATVRLGLRPLTRMGHISAEITAGDLSRRVADADPHTEVGRLGGALNSMLDRIEAEVAARTASEQRLRQFVADASHELRTPLTSVRGFAELYRRGGAPPGPELDEAMRRIEAEAARMGLLVEDLLMLARLDHRRQPVRRPVDLLAVAADTIRDAYARNPDRPVRMVAAGSGTDAVPDLQPVSVAGDEPQLRQVAANLVANAQQHAGPQAEITVRVGTVRVGVDAAPGRLLAAVGRDLPADVPVAVFEVADTGPGVPQVHAGRIFERLYRVDPSRSRAGGGGSGLGLAIAAAIVDGHGGRIELFDRPGGGAVFRVLLPGPVSCRPVAAFRR